MIILSPAGNSNPAVVPFGQVQCAIFHHKILLCTSQFQNRPSPTPGNPRAFDPKWGPPGGAFDFRVKTSVSGRKQKDLAILWFSTCTAFTGHCSCRFHVGFSVVVVFISWNMPLFKVWSEDKLNKKFVVAENFAELVSKGKRFCLYSFISWVHGVTEAACHWRVISQIIW